MLYFQLICGHSYATLKGSRPLIALGGIFLADYFVNFSSYITEGHDPEIYCVCDCEFSFTYHDGLTLYRQESTNSLELGPNTKVCTEEEVRDELKRFRKEMDSAVTEMMDKFTTKK